MIMTIAKYAAAIGYIYGLVLFAGTMFKDQVMVAGAVVVAGEIAACWVIIWLRENTRLIS